MHRLCPALAAGLVALCSCRSEMHDQPRAEPLERSDFFTDGTSARPRVQGTVARGDPANLEFVTGKIGKDYLTDIPLEIGPDELIRGMERYNIYCAPCHDRTGYGNGIIVQAGFRKPAVLHEQRLREAAPGYFFDVMTNGFGTMFAYADRISPRDRWLIVAYVRALQRSQNATLDDVPDAERSTLREGAP